VPRAAFTGITARLKSEVGVPLITTNRINMPDTAERILARGEADMVSMARPFLADPQWVAKARDARVDEINTCIACNQACLDHVFANKRASCLVNPRACAETELNYLPTAAPQHIAVVGAGPAGLACATVAAGRGHRVTLFDAASEIGGQFNLAKRIPGKEEFHETLRYFTRKLALTGVELRLGVHADAADLAGFDHVVLATGITPRRIDIPGIEHPRVCSYRDVLAGHVVPGSRVAIIGAGGIGFDVAEFLIHAPRQSDTADAPDAARWRAQWGVDLGYTDNRGGLTAPHPEPPAREVWLLQRSPGKPGARLGKTTGWIHRATLKAGRVKMLGGVSYLGIDDRGLRVGIVGGEQILAVDHIVVCAGQQPFKPLLTELAGGAARVHVIGGADVAVELDAKRAIDQGSRLAAAL